MRVVRCLVSLVLAVSLVGIGCQPRRSAPIGLSSNSSNATTLAATTTSVSAVLDKAELPVSGNESETEKERNRTSSISFDDLELKMKEDAVFDRSLLTERAKELEGCRVRIRGFIYPSIMQQTGITKFPLVKNTECKFGPGGVAHHIIVVEMQEGSSTSFTVRPIAVEGILSVRPYDGADGNTWAIYHMVCEKVD